MNVLPFVAGGPSISSNLMVVIRDLATRLRLFVGAFVRLLPKTEKVRRSGAVTKSSLSVFLDIHIDLNSKLLGIIITRDEQTYREVC